MSISKTELAPQIIEQFSSDIGMVHFFNHIAVVEFNEGVHVEYNNVEDTINAINNYFGATRPFGIVANKINSYSVSTLDIKDAREAVPNLKAYGIVSYNEAGRMSAQIESTFCERRDICFQNLYEGLDTIYQRVKDQIIISLN